MPTIALRVPTVQAGLDQLPGGQCYLIFSQPTLTLRDLIKAKVSGELRKARAGGALTTSLPLLLPEGTKYGFSPLDEQLAAVQACEAFLAGRYLVVCNGRPLVALDETLPVDRTTKVAFVISTPALQPAAPGDLEVAA